MANSQVCATQAATRDVANASATSAQDCSDVIHIAVFFDGTGNNKDADEGEKKWSNVARIWQSAWQFSRTNNSANTYPVYVSGVGTTFNGKAMFPGEELAIKLEDGALGAGAGAGGTRRLVYGQQQINDALRMALLGKAKTLDGQVASYAEAGKQQSFADVNRALGKHRLIKQINVSIFGFSRGAALARAFCNQWLWACKEDRGKLSYEGYPIRFCFLGLFDTVASFGLPATNSANHLFLGGFKGRDLVVDERVERCVHQVAAHELRFSFPVDLIRRDGELAGNWLEKVYPGVHSDIGGGYTPNEQDIDNNYSRIPMRDMMEEALGAGARLFDTAYLAKRHPQIYKERFECLPETESAYKAYRAACAPGGSVENQVRKHMEQLYSAYGTLHRQGRESVTQREHRKGARYSRISPDDMATELANYDKARQDLEKAAKRNGQVIINPVAKTANSAYIIRKGAYAMWIAPQDWQRAAFSKTAPEGVMDFVHRYLHDSKVGFLSNAEPFSYFSSRGISESSRSVRGWFEDQVARPVDKAYESTVDAANRAIDKGAEAARKAQEVVSEKARQAGDVISDTAKQIQRSASEVAEKGTEAARKAQEVISEKARQAGDVVSDTAKQIQRSASEAAGNVARQGKQIAYDVGKATQGAVDTLGSAWKYLVR